MKFNEIEQNVQNEIVDLLNNHLQASLDIVRKDKVLEPLLVIKGKKEGDNQLVSLQSADGRTDVDKAFLKCKELLKNNEFKYSIFSYSTKMGTNTGGISNAIKTIIIAEGGLAVTFFSPYVIKGLFNKTVHVGETVLYEIVENIFE
jgi:hypothetical protein